MVKFITILLTLLLGSVHSKCQTALVNDFPKVEVSVKVLNPSVNNFDSVKLLITLINTTDTVQRLIFNKPVSKTYPWGTSVLLSDSKGKQINLINREVLSSQLYTRNQLEEKNLYTELKPKESISHTYSLANMVLLDRTKGNLPNGDYTIEVSYYMNSSNKQAFSIQ